MKTVLRFPDKTEGKGSRKEPEVAGGKTERCVEIEKKRKDKVFFVFSIQGHAREFGLAFA